MGAGATQQTCISLARLARRHRGEQTTTFFMYAIMTRAKEAALFACWGNKWGNMPHGFQPIST
jgi:hypothetical protein